MLIRGATRRSTRSFDLMCAPLATSPAAAEAAARPNVPARAQQHFRGKARTLGGAIVPLTRLVAAL